MKAILQTEYGPPEVLQLTEVEKPTPTENQVLVKVHAASVNALEWRPFTMSPIMVRLVRGIGCRGGVCGACATIYRVEGESDRHRRRAGGGGRPGPGDIYRVNGRVTRDA